jgi:hypothetical protein
LVIRFTDLDNGSSVTLNSSGPSSIVFDPDGSLSLTARGPTGIGLFPTDQPPGPDTFINYGRIQYTVSPAGVLTIISMTGRTVDVCAMIA